MVFNWLKKSQNTEALQGKNNVLDTDEKVVKKNIEQLSKASTSLHIHS